MTLSIYKIENEWQHKGSNPITFRFPSTGLKALAESPYYGLNSYAKNETELVLGENINFAIKLLDLIYC